MWKDSKESQAGKCGKCQTTKRRRFSPSSPHTFPSLHSFVARFSPGPFNFRIHYNGKFTLKTLSLIIWIFWSLWILRTLFQFFYKFLQKLFHLSLVMSTWGKTEFWIVKLLVKYDVIAIYKNNYFDFCVPLELSEMKIGGNDYCEDDMGKEKWCKRYVSRRGDANVILQRQRRMITFSGTPACCYIHGSETMQIWRNTLEKYFREIL